MRIAHSSALVSLRIGEQSKLGKSGSFAERTIPQGKRLAINIALVDPAKAVDSFCVRFSLYRRGHQLARARARPRPVSSPFVFRSRARETGAAGRERGCAESRNKSFTRSRRSH